MILLISPKNVYATNRLIEEASKSNIPMAVLSMEELVDKNFEADIYRYNVLYIRSPFINGSPKHFPQIIALAKKFKAADKRVVDGVIAEGELGEGKMADYERLRNAKLPIPKTLNYELGIRNYEYPFIVKWTYGFKGRGFFFIQNKKDLENIPKHIPKNELMVQEFIDADYEYKVITVGYKALPAVLRLKINKKTHRPDFGQKKFVKGKELGNMKITEVIGLAEQASKILKRELAKVDILQKDNQFYILEVNRWPGLKSFEELTHFNAAQSFIEYLKQ